MSVIVNTKQPAGVIDYDAGRKVFIIKKPGKEPVETDNPWLAAARAAWRNLTVSDEAKAAILAAREEHKARMNSGIPVTMDFVDGEFVETHLGVVVDHHKSVPHAWRQAKAYKEHYIILPGAQVKIDEYEAKRKAAQSGE